MNSVYKLNKVLFILLYAVCVPVFTHIAFAPMVLALIIINFNYSLHSFPVVNKFVFGFDYIGL